MTPEEWATWYASKWPVKAAEYIARHDKEGDPDQARAAALKVALPARGCCRICGRALGKKLSVERGVGPDCWEKLQGVGPAS